MHFLYFTISNWSTTTQFVLKLHKTCLHQQKSYPMLKSFTQALLVMLVTNIMSASHLTSSSCDISNVFIARCDARGQNLGGLPIQVDTGHHFLSTKQPINKSHKNWISSTWFCQPSIQCKSWIVNMLTIGLPPLCQPEAQLCYYGHPLEHITSSPS